ncbi:hypothetical protein SAMN05444007_101327 [Cribrihabitans marinus]|uniref:Uncharacterized protein n=1 Tax=Cribrihabitans marinus TaxID=1227549 RepID=A0A1H6QWQ2_9RHOB|nr:hypothetical protein [Cribrihabitans marinus]GGH20040.1 hypothetical protein GCM10010973_03740 [Cribrihabitans marinus]SEI48131.1 hypothetical protein SAMN05444007_101327 [Cribrihabitans marinus]
MTMLANGFMVFLWLVAAPAFFVLWYLTTKKLIATRLQLLKQMKQNQAFSEKTLALDTDLRKKRARIRSLEKELSAARHLPEHRIEQHKQMQSA